MTTDPQAAIQKLREVAEKATPGPWVNREYSEEREEGIWQKVGELVCDTAFIDDENADFFVAARNTWEALIDCVEAAAKLDDEISCENPVKNPNWVRGENEAWFVCGECSVCNLNAALARLVESCQ